MKILFFANTDWYLYNYRLELAQALRADGNEVVLISPEGKFSDRLRGLGFRLVGFPLSRRGLNPLTELSTLVHLVRLYHKEKPDLVHQFTVKCVVYGSLACFFAVIRSVVNSVEGLGYVFTESGSRPGWLKGLVKSFYRLLLQHTWVIVLNSNDRQYLLDNRMADPGKITRILGTGVNISSFSLQPNKNEEYPLVILPARLLWEKGVGDFVEAARRLRNSGIKARFALVGAPDEGNPGTVKAPQLLEWEKEGVIEWWGWKENMAEVYAQASIVCLPTFYKEGLPKSLIEASACGRPIITTNISGCKDIVQNGENGLLVEPRDISGLVEALKYLVLNPGIREKMGAAGRVIAEEQFSSDMIIPQVLAVYKSCINGK